MPENESKFRKDHYAVNSTSKDHDTEGLTDVNSEIETTVNLKINAKSTVDSEVSQRLTPVNQSENVDGSQTVINNQSNSDSFSSFGNSQKTDTASIPKNETNNSPLPNENKESINGEENTSKHRAKNGASRSNDSDIVTPSNKNFGESNDKETVLPQKHDGSHHKKNSNTNENRETLNNSSSDNANTSGYRKNNEFSRRGQQNDDTESNKPNYRKNDNIVQKPGDQDNDKSDDNKTGDNKSSDNKSSDKKDSSKNTGNSKNPLDKLKNGKNIDEDEDKKKQAIKAIKKKILAFIMAHLHIILTILLIVLIIFMIVVLISAIDDSDDQKGSSNGGNVSAPISRSGGSRSRNCEKVASSPLSVTKTSLSKEEFVKLVQEYNSTNSAYNTYFKPNADVIYDVATRKGINPELVVIRAFNEGFAPMNTRDAAKNSYNFWGIGCYNGTNKFSSYSSFAAGVEGFCDTILRYETQNIYEVMNKYAYIGAKWFYPGNSGDGGCYYKSYIMPFLIAINGNRANDVEATCRDATQIPTTSEDQLAYSQYQVETNLLTVRKRIFKIDKDNETICNSYSVSLTMLTPDETRNVPKMTESSSGTINNLLINNGSSVTQFNKDLMSQVISAGPGTREGVVTAAVYVVNRFNALKYRLPYSFSGGHGAMYNNVNGALHDKVSSSYFGINPYIGENIYTGSTPGYVNTRNGKTKTYYNLGLDCSGFVTWALKNGGINRSISNAIDFKNDKNAVSYPIKDVDKYTGKPGDVVASDTHVGLILKYDSANRRYLVAEESDGLVNTYYNIDSRDKYSVVDMSYYYNNSKIADYAVEFMKGLYK